MGIRQSVPTGLSYAHRNPPAICKNDQKYDGYIEKNGILRMLYLPI